MMIYTLSLFALGRSLDAYEFEGIPSALCAIAICTINYFDTISAMRSFMLYLILDAFWRKDTIPIEIGFHHTITFLLTAIGYRMVLNSNSYELLSICSYLLYMEATSPFLYFGKAMKKLGMNTIAFTTLLILLILWLPFRILGPIRSLVVCLRFFPYVYSAQTFILILVILQFIWYARLFNIALSAIYDSKK